MSVFNCQDHNGIIPFQQPNIHIQLLTKLIQNLNTKNLLGYKDQDFRTILHLASEYLKAEDYIKVLETILGQHCGALSSLVQFRDIFGSTPFQLFVTHQNELPESYLLQFNQKSQESSDEFGRNNLHIATQHYWDKALLELLINQGYNVNSEDEYGNTPLSYALRNPKDFVSNSHIRFLYSRKADILHRNKNDETLVHIAAQLGKVEAIELLLQLGFKLKSTSICLRDKYGNTPLHYALRSHSRNKCVIVNLLVDQFPSDVNQPNNKGQCPLHYAFNGRNVDLSIQALEVIKPKITEWSDELKNELLAFVRLHQEAHIEDTIRYENLIGKLLKNK